jgi:hypothetical protein
MDNSIIGPDLGRGMLAETLACPGYGARELSVVAFWHGM